MELDHATSHKLVIWISAQNLQFKSISP